MMTRIGISTLLVMVGLASVAGAQPNVKPSPAKPPPRATGVVCNEGFSSGNRGTFFEVDSHGRYAAEVRIGAYDAPIVQKFFPELRVKPTGNEIVLQLPVNACTFNETGASLLVSCAATHATAPIAKLTYYKAPDEITIGRSITATNVKVELSKNDKNQLVLNAQFDATARSRKIKYAFTKTFEKLHARLEPAMTGGPSTGCAVTAELKVSALQ